MSEPYRRSSGPPKPRCRRFHDAIELEDVVARAFDLDKLCNSRLRICLDLRGKTTCSHLFGKLRSSNTGAQLKADVTQRLLAGRTENDVVMVIAERQEY